MLGIVDLSGSIHLEAEMFVMKRMTIDHFKVIVKISVDSTRSVKDELNSLVEENYVSRSVD
jgi:DNA-directed RNA polymerase subunit F